MCYFVVTNPNSNPDSNPNSGDQLNRCDLLFDRCIKPQTHDAKAWVHLADVCAPTNRFPTWPDDDAWPDDTLRAVGDLTWSTLPRCNFYHGRALAHCAVGKALAWSLARTSTFVIQVYSVALYNSVYYIIYNNSIYLYINILYIIEYIR